MGISDQLESVDRERLGQKGATEFGPIPADFAGIQNGHTAPIGQAENRGMDQAALGGQPAVDHVPAASVAKPSPISDAWTDLITRADVIMIEVGDLAHDSANAVLETAFWSQNIAIFEMAIIRLERFVRALCRARQARPYMLDKEDQDKLSAILDRPRSLEAHDDREAFLAYVRSLWGRYSVAAGPFIKENHPDLL